MVRHPGHAGQAEALESREAMSRSECGEEMTVLPALASRAIKYDGTTTLVSAPSVSPGNVCVKCRPLGLRKDGGLVGASHAQSLLCRSLV